MQSTQHSDQTTLSVALAMYAAADAARALSGAMAAATPTEAIIIGRLIEQAARLQAELAALRGAMGGGHD